MKEFSLGKVALYLVLGVAAVWLGLKVVGFAVGVLWNLLVPLLVVGGIGYLIYRAVRQKALPGNRRTLS